jgi:hypothetical protein
MSKKVEIRLPAVSARSQTYKLDRQSFSAPDEDSKVGSLLAGQKETAPVTFRIKGRGQPSTSELQAPVTKAHQHHATKGVQPSFAASRFEKLASQSLSFTAGDLCAQLDVFSRPIYQCDSHASTSTFNGVVQPETAVPEKRILPNSLSSAASTTTSLLSHSLASRALARLGSAATHTIASARPQSIGCDSIRLKDNGLFFFKSESNVSSGDVVHERAGLSDGNPAGLVVFDLPFLAAQKQAAAFESTSLTGTTSSGISSVDSEVLDVWIR